MLRRRLRPSIRVLRAVGQDPDLRIEAARTPLCDSGCDAGSHSCWTAGTPGCNDVLACCEATCAFDPHCCSASWDSSCVWAAMTICGPPPGICGAADHTAYEVGAPGCDDTACCESVCGGDPACCTVAWDAGCVATLAETWVRSVAACAAGGHDCLTLGAPGCSDAALRTASSSARSILRAARPRGTRRASRMRQTCAFRRPATSPRRRAPGSRRSPAVPIPTAAAPRHHRVTVRAVRPTATSGIATTTSASARSERSTPSATASAGTTSVPRGGICRTSARSGPSRSRPIACGETVHGTLWSSDQLQEWDTDWYALTLDALPSEVVLTVTCGRLAEFGIAETFGVPDCRLADELDTKATAEPCHHFDRPVPRGRRALDPYRSQAEPDHRHRLWSLARRVSGERGLHFWMPAIGPSERPLRDRGRSRSSRGLPRSTRPKRRARDPPSTAAPLRRSTRTFGTSSWPLARARSASPPAIARR